MDVYCIPPTNILVMEFESRQVTLAEQLVRHRTSLGVSQEAARRLGVDPARWRAGERGEREPMGGFRKRVERFLDDSEVACSGARRTA